MAHGSTITFPFLYSLLIREKRTVIACGRIVLLACDYNPQFPVLIFLTILSLWEPGIDYTGAPCLLVKLLL